MLVLTPGFPPAIKIGGPAQAVYNLVREECEDHEVIVVTNARDLGDARAWPSLSGRHRTMGKGTIYYVDFGNVAQAISIWRWLSHERFDIVLMNGMWNRRLSLMGALMMMVGALAAEVTGLMPRGELEPGAMALKPKRKRLAFPIVRELYSRTTDFIVATSPDERKHAQAAFPRIPVLLSSDSPDRLAPAYVPSESSARRLLFLGRIHPTKGLLQLLRAMALCPIGLTLTIAGPVVDEVYWNECLEATERLSERHRVLTRGLVGREMIREVFAAHDAYVSLTAGENFGHTIAESLQVGCPVIISDTTLWTQTVVSGGGSLVADRDDAARVAMILSAWAEMPQEELERRRQMSVEAYARFDADRPANPVKVLADQLQVTTPARRSRTSVRKGIRPWPRSERS